MPSRKYTNYVKAGDQWTTYDNIHYPLYQISDSVDDFLVNGGGHYGYPNFPPLKDIGGDFLVGFTRVKNGSIGVGTIQGGTSFQEYRYTGSMYTDLRIASGALPSYRNPNLYGSTAYRLMKPDRPNMEGLVAIYELKDLPGMLRERFHAKNLQEIGSYYLAAKFGWIPLLSDICNFVLTQMNAQKRLEQLIRDEGKPVRRRVRLSNNSSQFAEYNGTGNVLFPQLVTQFYGPTKWYDTWSRKDEIWASAQFKYWLPGGPRDIAWSNAMKRAIFGLRPSPARVYRAMPWTWLADWFTNVGDMIDNLSTTLVDRLAADYFYMMDANYVTWKRTGTNVYFRQGDLHPFEVSATGQVDAGYKSRVKGDPFGYGTSENSLSGVQLSILGALGLSRIR